MSRTDFVSLHTHTTYSYGDGYGQPADYVARALELQHNAVCLTEHGNVSSHVKLEKAIVAAQAEGFDIKGMYGCELYTRDTPSKHKYHLCAIAMDDGGYRSLLRTVSKSWDNFYYFPTTTSKMLLDHGDGLIILSGCLGSAIACRSIGGKDVLSEDAGGYTEALRIANWNRERFGDRYYLEVQAFPELPNAIKLNLLLEKVSMKTGIPLVVTLDAHYPRETNQQMHSLVHAIARGGAAQKKTVDQIEGEWNYNVPMTLFSRQDVGRRLFATGMSRASVTAALDATVEIANRCNVTLPKTERVRFPIVGSGFDNAFELLWDWLRNGWRYRGFGRLSKRDQNFAFERLKMEMEQIHAKDFDDYFLMLGDVISWAKDKGILVGPARGSAAASLVCYLLRITEVNPLEFRQMYFERFIDPNRTDLPDIDLDFDDERRDEIRRYLVGKFGIGHVGNIGTYTRYRGKNSIDDVARVTRVPTYETKRLKEFIIERSSGDSRYDKTLVDTIEQFPLAKEIWDRNPSLQFAFELEGMLKSMGVHSAGLVVSNAPLTDTVALYNRVMPSRVPGGNPRKMSVLSVDKKDAEYLGMMKIDMLGLTTLGMLKHCMEFTNMSNTDLYALPYNDEKVIDAFRRGDVKGIFQFEGRTTRMVTSQLRPDNFQELVDINALSRPGPFHSGLTLNYINQKWGLWDKDSDANKWTQNEIVKSICGYTKDQMIYQEQLLAICREMAGLPWVVLGEIRKIISLKYGEAAFNAHKQRFIDGAVAHGHDAQEADSIFRHMITAGQYSFNLAHSVSYSLLAYWSMWYKVYHPSAFYAASLRKAPREKWTMLMRDALDAKENRGISIEPCDLDLSGITWGIGAGGSNIIPGFSQIPGIGLSLSALIVAGRMVNWNHGDDFTLKHVSALPGIGPKKLALIEEWCGLGSRNGVTGEPGGDPFGVNGLKIKLDEVRGMLRNGQLMDQNGRMLPTATHKAEDLPFDIGVSFDGKGGAFGTTESMPVVWVGRVHGRNLRDLFEEYRSREGKDLDPDSIREPDKKHSMVLYAYDDTDEINVRISRWKFPNFKDMLMKARLDHDLIVVDGFKNRSFGRKIEVNNMWVIDPE
jgi:DNA polymerase III subunit alpha